MASGEKYEIHRPVLFQNIAAGSICRRYGVRKGHTFKTPLLELFYKDDELHDPLVRDDVVLEMGWCNHVQLAEVKRQAHIVHKKMTEYWKHYDLTLVDQKFEFGIDAYGCIMLADEITPDSCRLWDEDGNSLDKDVFRQGTDMNKVATVYNYIHDLRSGCNWMKVIFKNRGDIILREGEESSDAYIILEGEVEVTKNSRVLATLGENSIFGEIALVDQRPRTATCKAKTNVKLGKVTRENYKQLIKHRPEALNPLLRVITDRMRNLTDFLEDLYKEAK